MAELKEYKITQNGVESTLLLNDEDAAARGLTGGKKRSTEVATPEENADTAEAQKARASVANKAQLSSPNK